MSEFACVHCDVCIHACVCVCVNYQINADNKFCVSHLPGLVNLDTHMYAHSPTHNFYLLVHLCTSEVLSCIHLCKLVMLGDWCQAG